MLEVKGLTAGYTSYPVIQDISFTVEDKSIVAIIGPNGAGKTALMRAVLGQINIFSGKVVFGGEDVTKLPTHFRVKKGLTLVPERRRIFPNMTVLENLQVGGYLVKDSKTLERRLSKVFELFPILKKRSNQRAGTLSGGEQQMLSLGRALMLEPRILLLDEPSVGLAPKVIDQVYDSVVNLNKEGLTILVVEQNIGKALAVAENAFVLQRGQIVIQASSSELAKNPKLVSTYLTGY